MKNIKKILIAFMLFIVITVSAQKTSKFSVVTKGVATSILFDKDDAKVVEIASEILSQDILKVSNSKVLLNSDSSKNVIIAGTIGESKWIDDLISNNKIDVSKVKDKWETYSIQVVNNPTKEIDKALVVVGSDRRATAFGLLEISRMIGVSPWEWWADVTPVKQKEIVLKVETKIYGSPSVKYRGIFLNDEDWGLQRWAALNFEPETGDIGPKTYAKVFELVLRLRANTLWPAMHSCTAPFYSYPKNKQVADDYAIVVGTSHCEPMLCNINSEWESKKMGEWRYDNNETSIKELFKDRTKETNGFESMYTMGMRGEHDSPMIVGEDDSDSQMKLLEKVVSDQRNILDLNSGKNKEDVPQIFIPYKEVLTYYQGGMELPEDISLVWTDDNYGYIRQLSTPEEQLRSGGAGIYYHTSYWGRPHDYLWLNSTNPVLMWEEMSKAYEFKSRNLWILNCGDIKPHEYNIELFLDMAWNMENFKESTQVKEHHTNWASREFGNENAEEITALMYNYYQLAFQRRPEFMAWSEVEPVTKSGKTELTQIHYADEVSKRIESYSKLIDKVEDLYTDVAVNRKDAFYQLIYYPVIGASSLNNKWLYKYKNEFVAKQGRKSAISFGQKSLDAFSRIEKETNYYNTKLNKGKWNHIMNMAPRFLPFFLNP
ncbi:glycosyl hydrolase 115 family protein [Polaribacter sejongensis]|uniref:glycosyl hydrolase 115 family protein n=1 Tax=Polaribacter sejongensis TaxID=985043 RepID=UPI0035A6827F